MPKAKRDRSRHEGEPQSETAQSCILLNSIRSRLLRLQDDLRSAQDVAVVLQLAAQGLDQAAHRDPMTGSLVEVLSQHARDLLGLAEYLEETRALAAGRA